MHQQTRRQLGDVYAWFTEGFETADLVEAKTGLVELASYVSGESRLGRAIDGESAAASQGYAVSHRPP